MAVLQLSPHHLQTICTHAEKAYPEECCGIMLGQVTDEVKTLVEVWQTENVWSDEKARDFPVIAGAKPEITKRRHYTIAPSVLLRAQREARDRHLAIIGIYHSHPDHPAQPSEFDRIYAWPQYSYMIVSVQQGQAYDIKSWSLDDNHQFIFEEIEKLT